VNSAGHAKALPLWILIYKYLSHIYYSIPTILQDDRTAHSPVYNIALQAEDRQEFSTPGDMEKGPTVGQTRGQLVNKLARRVTEEGQRRRYQEIIRGSVRTYNEELCCDYARQQRRESPDSARKLCGIKITRGESS
jgi:hypothetical protein